MRSIIIALFVLPLALACGGSSRSDDGGSSSDGCGASSCDGCCDASGECQVSDDRTCGVGGAMCASCGSGTTCGGSGSCSAASGLRCSVAADCASVSCMCRNGRPWSSRYCVNGSCSSREATCTKACEDEGGWSGSNVADPPPVSQVWGCSLSRWSNDFSVNVEYFGSGYSEVSARDAATTQCQDAEFRESFCTSGTYSCAKEHAYPYNCTWSKFSTTRGTTIQYLGEGDGESAASADALGRCLDSSENWKGWFCGSGSVSCRRQ